MLLFERGDTLHFLPAVPEAWRQPGAEIKLDPSSTRFGSFGVRSIVDERGHTRIGITMDEIPGYGAETYALHIPKDSIEQESVRLNGEPVDDFSGGILRLTPRPDTIVEYRLSRKG